MKRRSLYTFNERIRQPLRASVVRDVQRVSCYCQCPVIWLCVGGLRGVTAAMEYVRNGSLRMSLHVWCIYHVQTGTCLNTALAPIPQLSRAANRSSASSHLSQCLDHGYFDSLHSSSASRRLFAHSGQRSCHAGAHHRRPATIRRDHVH
jgi:hypothetical protein